MLFHQTSASAVGFSSFAISNETSVFFVGHIIPSSLFAWTLQAYSPISAGYNEITKNHIILKKTFSAKLIPKTDIL